MKNRIIFLLILLLGLNFSLQGQRVGAGLSLGFNAAQIDGDGVGGYKKMGLMFGGYAFYDFSEKFSFEPGIQYSQKGSREVEVGLLHLRFHYIEVPLMFNYNIHPRRTPGDDKIVIHGGPSLGYTIGVTGGFRPGTFDVTDNYQRLDYGLHAGVTYYFNPIVGITFRKSIGFFWLNFQNSPGNTWPWLHRYFTLALRVGIK